MADVFGSSSSDDEDVKKDESNVEKKSEETTKKRKSDVFGSSSEEEEEEEKKKKKDDDDEFDDFDGVKGGGSSKRVIDEDAEDMEASNIPGPSSKLYGVKQGDMLRFRPEAFEVKDYDQNRIDYEDKKYGVAMGQVVRWKEVDGEIVSNARIVEWSDGSMMLQVGNNFFKMKQQAESAKDNNYVYLQQKYRVKGDKSDENGKTFLQSHGKIHTKISFQPVGERVRTKKLLKIKEQTLVESRVRTIVAGDASKERAKALKKAQEEERIKAREAQNKRDQMNAQIEAMQRRMALEEEDELSDSALDAGETQTLSINNLKKKTLTVKDGDDIFGDSDSDEDDDDDFDELEKKKEENKIQEEMDVVVEEDEDEDEVQEKIVETKKKVEEEEVSKQADTNVTVEVDDDEGDVEAAQRPKKRARRTVIDDDSDSD